MLIVTQLLQECCGLGLISLNLSIRLRLHLHLLQALEYTREHYNRHAGQYASTQEALYRRETGPGAPLKKFHNAIKRQLIQRQGLLELDKLRS